ncbi:MAG: thioesterase [Flavisolibacter sp.]|jgi:hypothetical protein|nr:thioesterase [Flavisolibacter sp.]
MNAVQHETKNDFHSLVRNPLKFRFFLLKNLPAAYFSGLKLNDAGENRCEVSIPYKWFTRNPFRSTYFACLSMAAEMTTGILAMGHTYGQVPKISMLVVAIEGNFHKRAVGITKFICEAGREIGDSIDLAKVTGVAQTVRAISSGYNDKGELVAEFWITWSFKQKS